MSGSKTFENVLYMRVLEWLVVLAGANELETIESKSLLV